jgi:malate dehydrogenase (oxaloacetate-decarboxylating)(NADP+)
MTKDYTQEALDYHSSEPKGKLGIALTKQCDTQHDLALAYSPGVAKPCIEIDEDKSNVWKYTNRGNTVAIISDGSAVLGLGNIGPEAGLPVMEGKCVLFKKFADIDSYPICLELQNDIDSEEYLDEIADIAASLQPSLGGINLEDIKGPQCFGVLQRVVERCSIPVFHDDQDGTGIIILAGVFNALKFVGKDIEQVKFVINGAGAAGIACGRLLNSFGVDKSHIYMCDSKGLITKSREINQYKEEFAQDHEEALLEEVVKDADVFIGVSQREVLSQDMVKTMASDPIIFAVANPVPEIMPELAYEAGAVVVGTGRSDYANQVNNSLGFPGLFRAALDTRSTAINQEMKVAAIKAIASLVYEQPEGEVLDVLKRAYPEEAAKGMFESPDNLLFDYMIPKQFDLRVVPRVAREVAKAAIDSGVATVQIDDLDAYEKEVYARVRKNWSV